MKRAWLSTILIACLVVLGIARRADAAALTLAWDPNPETDIAGYVVYYGTQPGTYTTNVDAGNVTSKQLTNLVAGTTYYFAVKAYNTSGLFSDASQEISGVVAATTDTQPPSIPTITTATATSSTQIRLTWTASTDNVGVTGYRLERCQGAGCTNFTQVGTAPATSYSDSGLSAATSYSYRVRATDAAVNLSGYSTTASATTQTPAPGSPFGQIDTPPQNFTGAQGAVGVTGWALDDIGVRGVRVYRECLAIDDPASCQRIDRRPLVFIAEAAFLAGARPDVEAAYPAWPQAHRAGWGALILTNMLPDVTRGLRYGGQGPLTLYAYAWDDDGHSTLLGRSVLDHTPTRISISNDTLAKPFGTIDTPALGATVSGVLVNFGWSLTPDSDFSAGPGDVVIPPAGTSMFVFVDGQPLGPVTYDQCRGSVGNPVPGGVYCNDDIASIFGSTTPQQPLTTRIGNPTRFRNLDAGRGAIGAFLIDTTTLQNGLHTIAWSVTDSAGRTEGIGSRFFTVLNSDVPLDAAAASGAAEAPVPAGDATPIDTPVADPAYVASQPATPLRDASDDVLPRDATDAPPQSDSSPEDPIVGPAATVVQLPVALTPVWARVGFAPEQHFSVVPEGRSGTRTVSLPQLGRLELAFTSAVTEAYVVTGPVLRKLPIGSSLTPDGRGFAWMPPVAYLGAHELVFISEGVRIPVRVVVTPRFSSGGKGAEPGGRLHTPVQPQRPGG